MHAGVCSQIGQNEDRARRNAVLILVEAEMTERQKKRRESILELIQIGMAPNDIKEQVGCCLTLVYLVAKDNGIDITHTVYKNDLPDAIKEKMIADAESGMSSETISERYNVTRNMAKEICRGHFARVYDIDNAKAKIDERLPGFEYVGNFTGSDGECDIRCKTCGTVKHVKSQAIRHGSARCAVCFERERAERNNRKIAEIEERRKQREDQKRQTILRREEKKRQERLDHISVFSCEVCGAMFLADDRHKNRFCSDACARRSRNKQKELNRRIKIENQMVNRDISLERLYQRDGGICYLCGRVCDWNDREVVDGIVICGDTYPSIDHFIPLSKKGKHSWMNVKLACRKCNSNKRDSLIGIDREHA